jgi:EmrB/QacA subfamily drug resistance transporter
VARQARCGVFMTTMTASAPFPHAAVPSLTREQRVLTLAGMLLAMFLAALDQTVVATAGPEIMRSLAIDAGLYTWLTTAYLVASTVLVPVFGKLSDLYGRKRIIFIGVVIFLVASALCGVSTTTTQLIVFRALQGVGSASIFTSAFAVVADLFAPAERGKYSGLFGAMFGLSSLVGPLLGGFITDHFGWHWVFFINLPIGLVALAFIALRMPPLIPTHDRKPTIDVGGALLLAVGVVPLLLALSLGRPTVREGELGLQWLDWRELALFVVAAAGLVGFTWWELRVKEPLVDLRLFRDPTVRWGVATVFVMGGVFLTPMVFLPLFMVNVVGVTAMVSGLTISPMVLGVVAGNVLSGQVVSRVGRYKELMLLSLGLLVVGFTVMILTLTPDSTQAEVTAKMVLLGLGLGPSIPLYTIAIQNAVPLQHIGVATSMVTFFRQMGSTVGIAVVGSLFATTLSGATTTGLAEAVRELPPAMAEAFTRPPRTQDQEGGAARFDGARAKAQARGQLEAASLLAKKALAGDALATVLVAQSPLADERLKAIARGGGVRAQVQRSFASLRARVDAAAGSADGWSALRQAVDLPVELKSLVVAVPAAALADSVARANVLTQAHQLLETSERVAEDKALEQATAQVDQTVTAALPRVLAAIDATGVALKRAFTDAITRVHQVALGLVLLALVLTARLPRLQLRRGAATPPAAAE